MSRSEPSWDRVRVSLALAVALTAYALSTAALPGGVRVVVVACALASVVGAWRPWAWTRASAALAALALAVVAALAWDELANHHFVLTLFALGVAVDDDARTSPRMAAALLGTLMAVATAQKLVSPVFVSGDYFAYLLSTGGLGGPLLEGLDALGLEAWSQAVHANEQRVLEFAVAAEPGARVDLPFPLANLGTWAFAFSAFVLAFEAWLACVYLRAPRHRAAAVSLLVFVLGLVLMREEWVFGATLCAMGVVAAPGAPGRPPTWEVRGLAGLAVVFAGLAVVS